MTFWDNNNLFGFLLVFLGLRKSTKIKKTRRNSLKKMIQRKVICKKIRHPERQRQPRNLIRNIYREVYNEELSPTMQSIYSNDSESEGDSDSEQIPTQHKVNSTIKKWYYSLISWGYSVIISMFLLVQPIYLLYYIFTHENIQFYWSSFFFGIIPFVQYILSLIYFRTSHFEDFYLSKEYVDPKCFPSMNVFVVLIILGTFVSNILNQLVLLGMFNLERDDGEFPNFSDYQYRPLISLFLWIVWTYGRFTVFTNLTIFSLVFCKHCKIIHNYVKKLERNCSINALTINTITQEVLNIRHNLEESIDLFKNIFSSFTLLGAIGFGFFMERIQNGNFELFPWHLFVIYALMQIVFLVIVLRVSSNKESLSDYIRQPKFIDKFLKRYNTWEIQEKFKGDINMVQLNILEENASTLDWMVLNDIFNEQWTEFKVMGIDISNGALIKQGIVIVTLIVTINQIFLNNQ